MSLEIQIKQNSKKILTTTYQNIKNSQRQQIRVLSREILRSKIQPKHLMIFQGFIDFLLTAVYIAVSIQNKVESRIFGQ